MSGVLVTLRAGAVLVVELPGDGAGNGDAVGVMHVVVLHVAVLEGGGREAVFLGVDRALAAAEDAALEVGIAGTVGAKFGDLAANLGGASTRQKDTRRF